MRLTNPITAIKDVTAIMGFGHLTTAVPTLRQPRSECARFGSKRPNLDTTTSNAGASVRPASMVTTKAMAHGTPMVWKYGSLVADRHKQAPTIVRPEPMMMCATPW